VKGNFVVEIKFLLPCTHMSVELMCLNNFSSESIGTLNSFLWKCKKRFPFCCLPLSCIRRRQQYKT